VIRKVWQMHDLPTGAPLVVGVSGRSGVCAQEPEFPVRWAAQEALLRGVPLWLAHAYLGGSDRTGPAQQAVRGLERTAAWLAADHPELEVAMFARCGTAVAVLGDLALDAGLTVVGLGRRTQGRVAEAVLGSVTAGLARTASSPVVAVPAHASYTAVDAPLVVGVNDLGGPSTATLDFAFAEARARRVPLRFVHCLPSRGPQDLAWTVERQDAAMRAVVTSYQAAYPSVPASVEIVDGEPGEVLVKESVTAGMVVLGPGRGWTAGWRLSRLGPVGHEVLNQAACPVVLLRDVTEAGRA
jgi:nucleotide-binding universal stress UspA family protein